MGWHYGVLPWWLWWHGITAMEAFQLGKWHNCPQTYLFNIQTVWMNHFWQFLGMHEVLDLSLQWAQICVVPNYKLVCWCTVLQHPNLPLEPCNIMEWIQSIPFAMALRLPNMDYWELDLARCSWNLTHSLAVCSNSKAIPTSHSVLKICVSKHLDNLLQNVSNLLNFSCWWRFCIGLIYQWVQHAL